MGETRYRIPFVIAVLINLLFVGFLYMMSHDLFRANPEKKETVIAIDMSRYEVQGNDATKPKDLPGGGNKGSTKATGSKTATTTKASTPYVGGVESSDVGVAGVQTSGTIGGAEDAAGDGASSGDGSGNGSGDSSGSGTNGGHGYVDLAGYIAKLNAIKQYPGQALRLNQTGTATFSVTFSADGDVISIDLISSSGHSILDKAARNLIANGGRIINTTGQSVTETIPIRYELNE